MPKVSQTHLDARRQQILDAAVECFSRQGFHPTTMQDIIKEAGLSSGAIYSYFASKEELIEAIAERRHARELALIQSAGVQDEITITVERLIQSFFHLLVDPKEKKERRLGIQLWGEALRNPRILGTVRKGVDEPRAILTRLLEDARDQGDLLPGCDPEAMARAMIALFQGLVLQLAWDRTIEVEPLVEVVRKMIIATYLRTEASPVRKTPRPSIRRRRLHEGG
jgi:TetR/AcrR family transcriptional regulator, transcriptional repressor of aconitase